MKQFQFNNLTIRYTDSEFTAFEDTMVFYSDISLDEEPWNDEMAAIIKEIKIRLKSEKQKDNDKLNESLSSLGEMAGKRKHYFDIDNRLYYALKSKNVNMTKFINAAIMEKLTREE